MPELKQVKISDIKIPEVRVGSILDDEQKALLASTVKQVGVIQDPVVRALQDGSYELVAGRSRIMALAAQGAVDVTVKVIDADEKLGLIMNITENVARGAYDYISISKAIKKLREMGTADEELEKIFPWKARWINFLAGLSDLPDDIQDAIAQRKLTPSHVMVALDMPTPYEVHDALKTALNLDWDSGTLKTYVLNRVAQIEAVKEAAKLAGTDAVIPPPDPTQLIQYRQCLVCGFKKPSEQITAELVCDDCRKIAKYITSQFGSTEDALNLVYEAIKLYFSAPRSTDVKVSPSSPEPHQA